MRPTIRDLIDGTRNLGNTSDPCSSVWGNSTCDRINIDGLEVQSPALLPTCLLAAIIGFYGYSVISKTNVRGSKIYALTFLMFGTMMSDAGFNDCILAVNGTQGDLYHIFFGILDVGLTSSIGLTFAFNGLVDIGLIPETNALFAVLGVLYGCLFAGWYYTFATGWEMGFVYLYVYVIGFSCGIYCITEFIYLIRSGNRKGLYWVVLAGLTGGFGLAAVAYPQLSEWICETLGCHFGGNFVWFLLSDVAMYALFGYFCTRIQSELEKSKLNNDKDAEQPFIKNNKGYVPLKTWDDDSTRSSMMSA